MRQRQEANDKLDSIVERAYRTVDHAFDPKRRYGARGTTTIDFEILPRASGRTNTSAITTGRW